jgi:hypothetical protein
LLGKSLFQKRRNKVVAKKENCKLTGSIHVDGRGRFNQVNLLDEFMQAKNLKERNTKKDR